MEFITTANQLENTPKIHPCALISSMPNEILSGIFEAAYIASCMSSKLIRQELRLAAVDRRWRSIAVTTPQLWRKIRMRFSVSSQNDQMAEQYFSRSGILPVDINLTIGTGGADAGNPDTVALFQLFTRYIHRWSHLRLSLKWPGDLTILLATINMSPAPCLKLFDVRLVLFNKSIQTTMSEEYHVDHTMFFSAGAPSLTHVSFQYFKPRACPPSLNSVTHLQLQNLGRVSEYVELSSVLEHLTALRYLMLKGRYYWDSHAPDATLPSLLTLRINISSTAVCLCLDRIFAPKLQDITFEDFNHDTYFHPPPDPHLSAARFPSLRSLTISSIYNDHISKYETLWTRMSLMFPNISRLILISHNKSFSEFVCARTFPPPWPGLHTLTIVPQGHGKAAREMLCRSMKVRNELSHPIQKVQLAAWAISSLTSMSEWAELQPQPEVEVATFYSDPTATGVDSSPKVVINNPLGTRVEIADLIDDGFEE